VIFHGYVFLNGPVESECQLPRHAITMMEPDPRIGGIGMSMFNKKIPESSVFGATAMILPLCIETVYEGGTTNVMQRINHMSAVRQTLVDLDGRFPGCSAAIGALDQHHPVDPLSASIGLRGGFSSGKTLTAEQISSAESLASEAEQALHRGLTGNDMVSVGESMCLRGATLSVAGPDNELGEHCGLILGLALDKTNHDVSSAKNDERDRRRHYSATLAGFWLLRVLQG